MMVVASLLGMCPVALHANGNSVVLTENTYEYFPGGEFTANTTQDFLRNYSPLAIVNTGLGNGFETFCMETEVEFNPGQTYTYTLGSVDSQGTALTQGAAYLYQQFGKGTLAGYNYAATGTPSRNTDAGALQSAIWGFQGGQSISCYGFPNYATDPFYLNAIAALGGLANAEAPNTGRFAVDVLQLWDGNTPAQNQVVLVPDSGATAGLFAMGLTVLGVVRRRF